jgi:hypothetical protein
MQTCTDIRAQVDADMLLQREINLALLAVADTLASGVDPRMLRILARILKVSWTEHVTFQDEVVVPILAARHTGELTSRIADCQTEHGRIADLHAEICRHLENILEPGDAIPQDTEALLRSAHARRQSHLDGEAVLDALMPHAFNAAECALCDNWMHARHSQRFPLDLVRSGRPYPQPCKPMH